MMECFKYLMKREFKMTDLGEMKYFLGVEAYQSLKCIHISQRKHVEEMLKRFCMKNCNGVTNPMVLGSNRLSKKKMTRRLMQH